MSWGNTSYGQSPTGFNANPLYCSAFFLKLHLFTPKIQTILFPDAADMMWKSKFSLNT